MSEALGYQHVYQLDIRNYLILLKIYILRVLQQHSTSNLVRLVNAANLYVAHNVRYLKLLTLQKSIK